MLAFLVAYTLYKNDAGLGWWILFFVILFAK
jgi:hypothetical protein